MRQESHPCHQRSVDLAPQDSELMKGEPGSRHRRRRDVDLSSQFYGNVPNANESCSRADLQRAYTYQQ
ncbi:unnamed protein product [Knipowitschia caucasica]